MYTGRMNARGQLINALPSVLWTALFVWPVWVFCARYVSSGRFACFWIAGMVSAVALPKAVFRGLCLSSNPAVYRWLRVGLLIKVTQDAAWIRRLSGSSERRVQRQEKAIASVVSDTWVRERFHFGVFVFCALCSAVALEQARAGWFVGLSFLNVVYDVYPMWLQQYLRLRVERCQERLRVSAGVGMDLNQ